MRQKSELRSGQQHIIDALYQNNEMICALRPGGGKTIAALTAIEELICHGEIRHALVTAPKRVARIVWPDELETWENTSRLRCAVLSAGPAERSVLLHDAPNRDLTIFGHDIIEWLIMQIDKLPSDHPLFDLLVIDEISRFRNPRGKRYKLLCKHIHRWRMVWGLSGTLRPSSAMDLFGPVRLVSRGKLWGRSFYQWQKERFFPTDYNGYNWEPKPGAEDRINAEIVPWLVTAEIPQLPEPTIVLDRLELPEAARREYNRMERRLIADIGQNETVIADSRAIAIGKLSQMSNGFIYSSDNSKTVHALHDAKRDWLRDLIETSTSPMLLIYEFREDLSMLRELLGDSLPYLGAGVSDKRAEQHVKRWNEGRLPFMALHPASAAHGLNLQHGGADMTWIAPTWNSELWEQTIARLHRSGQTRQVVIRVGIAIGTIDEMKLDRVHLKLSAQQSFERYVSHRTLNLASVD
jgi:SNF2 family DNA or RNA helicase